MAKLGTERSSVQNPLIQYAREIGWDYISSEEAERLRGGRTGLILKDEFMNQILKFNSTFIDNLMIEELIRRIERLPTSVEGNFQAWEYLKGIRTVYVPKEKRERNVTFIDKNIKRNTFQVTDEYTFTNGTFTNRFDIVFFINGFPVYFVETKASHKMGGMEDALDQVRRYHREIPEPFTLLQVYTLTHLIQFIYSSTWSFSMKGLFNWKVEGNSRDFETLMNYKRSY